MVTPFIMILYFHINPKTTDIFYVGIGRTEKRSVDFKNSRRNIHWQRYVEKHGEPVVEIVQKDVEKNIACAWERFYISLFKKIKDGGTLVNITDGGEGSFGLKMSDEAKEKMRLKKVGHIASEETKERMSIAKIGKSHSEEAKLNMSLAQTESVRDAKRKGQIGRKKSPEHIEKVRQANLGKKRSPEFREACRIRATKKDL